MKLSEVIAFADPYVDQQGLAKAMVAKFAIPALEELKRKVESKEIDLLKNTSMENELIAKVLQSEIDKLKAV